MEAKHDELKLRAEWAAEAKTQTLETLPSFLAKLSEFDHDYGTICHAMASAALGAAWAMNASPRGGITGFQAGCVLWGFIKEWNHLKNPARLVDYGDLLYPQYEEKFRCISGATWEWLQSEARKSLAEKDQMHRAVRAHMQSIADGVVPFGMSVAEH